MNARRAVLAIATSVLALVAATMSPAAAATPAQVGLISFTGAGLVGTDRASLTMRWPAAANATSYELFISPVYDNVLNDSASYRKTTSTSITLDQLKRGVTYYITVRGLNGSSKGKRAARVGRTTISAQGPGRGAAVSVMTWNLCSEKSSCNVRWSWSTRQPTVLRTIESVRPNILALQEARGLAQGSAAEIPGYTQVAYYSSKSMYIRDDVLSVVGRPADASPFLSSCTTAREGRYGCLSLGNGRYAVWAELQHATTGERFIATSAHLTSGSGSTESNLRTGETTRLVDGANAVNPEGLPVLFAGDFNSNRSRGSLDTPAKVMAAKGYTDAYDLATAVSRQHQNSYNDWQTTPKIGVTWGDHVDKVWVKAPASKVTAWWNASLMTGSSYTSPLGSDHSPVRVIAHLR